jgi:hypothetical protein
MRRIFGLLVALALFASNFASVVAQDASPGAMGPSKLSQAGLPELRLTATADGLQAPAEVAAGTVLLVLDNQSENFVGVSLIQLPEGTSMEEAMMVLGPPPAPEGSPEAGAEASPAGGEEEMGPPPPLFYEMTWGGGVFAPPGVAGEIVVTLTPGQWVLASDPESGMMPISMTVTGEAPTPVEVPADATVTLKNFSFELPADLAAGQQVWEVTNAGDDPQQPHEMFVTKTPRRLTLEEVEVLLALPEDELPPEGYPNPAEFQDIGGVAPISADQTVYFELNLEPGAYVAVCFMPEKESGEPHAMKGMIVVFEVPEEGQTVEPPASPVPVEEHDMEGMGTPTS